MDCIYVYETEPKNLLQLLYVGVGRELRGRDGGGIVNNVQYQFNQNCYSESPHNEYILIKNLK
jgi:hypothetical protein